MFTLFLFFFLGPLVCYLLAEKISSFGIFSWIEGALISFALFFGVVAFLPKLGIEIVNFRAGETMDEDSALIVFLSLGVVSLLLALVPWFVRRAFRKR